MSDATKPPDWFNNFNHAIQQKLSAYMPMADIQVVVEEARKLFAAESAPLRERAERAEFDRDNYKAAWTEVDRGLKESREVLSTALADAAALRERVEGLEATDRVREYTIRSVSTQRDEAVALALTNGEARGRAEAEVAELRRKLIAEEAIGIGMLEIAEARAVAAEAELAKLRADMEDMVTEAGRATELDAKLERLADGLTENGRAIDAAIVARAERAEADRDGLRGRIDAGVALVDSFTACKDSDDELGVIHQLTEWAHSAIPKAATKPYCIHGHDPQDCEFGPCAAIPEGWPGEGKG